MAESEPAPNTYEWRYGQQRNKGESAEWRRRRLMRPSAVAWRTHQAEHTEPVESCNFCRFPGR